MCWNCGLYGSIMGATGVIKTAGSLIVILGFFYRLHDTHFELSHLSSSAKIGIAIPLFLLSAACGHAIGLVETQYIDVYKNPTDEESAGSATRTENPSTALLSDSTDDSHFPRLVNAIVYTHVTVQFLLGLAGALAILDHPAGLGLGALLGLDFAVDAYGAEGLTYKASQGIAVRAETRNRKASTKTLLKAVIYLDPLINASSAATGVYAGLAIIFNAILKTDGPLEALKQKRYGIALGGYLPVFLIGLLCFLTEFKLHVGFDMRNLRRNFRFSQSAINWGCVSATASPTFSKALLVMNLIKYSFNYLALGYGASRALNMPAGLAVNASLGAVAACIGMLAGYKEAQTKTKPMQPIQ